MPALRPLSLVLLLGWLTADAAIAEQRVSPQCLMAPQYPELRFPARGLVWMDGADLSGKCDEVESAKWIRKRSGPHELWVYPDGPAGSGHYWMITVGIAGPKHPKPLRGVCLTTTTVGWKTLQNYQNSALPWLEDVDGDGNAEVIVWDSFLIGEQFTGADSGLVAWVYRLVSKDFLPIDWNLSKAMARKVAAAYRLPLDPSFGRLNPSIELYLRQQRAKAADALEQFADGQCSIAANSDH